MLFHGSGQRKGCTVTASVDHADAYQDAGLFTVGKTDCTQPRVPAETIAQFFGPDRPESDGFCPTTFYNSTLAGVSLLPTGTLDLSQYFPQQADSSSDSSSDADSGSGSPPFTCGPDGAQQGDVSMGFHLIHENENSEATKFTVIVSCPAQAAAEADD